MASIAEVAAVAGVSPTTVSHALSGKRNVSEAVRQRVMRAMDELGYVPSRSAQGLASGRTRILGLIVPDIGNGYFAELARGVERTAMEDGYNVILCTTGFDHERELFSLQTIRSRAVDGIIYATGAPPSVSRLTKVLGNLPVVLVDEEVPGATMPAFVSDNEEGGRLAAEHLLGLGYRRTVVAAGPDALYSSRQRVTGFRKAWLEGGGHPPKVLDGAFTEEGGRAVGAEVLASVASGEVNSVFAANDLMAIGLLDVLREAGVECPKSVSVVGFDDSGAARYVRPHLTTVRQQVVAMGAGATTALISALRDNQPVPPTREIVPVELIVRESTGIASASKRKKG